MTNDTGKTGFVQWMSRFYSPAHINRNVIAQRFYKAIAFTIHVWLPKVLLIFVTKVSTVGFIPLGITRVTQVRGLKKSLKSPDTCRVYFGSHNFLCILATPKL